MFDKAKVQQISREMEAALAEVARRHGITVTRGNVKYSADNFDIKFAVARVNSDGVVVTKEAKVLEMFFPGVVGKTFVDRGSKIQFIGYNSRSHKYPLLYKNHTDGKTYKTSRAHLEQLVKQAA